MRKEFLYDGEAHHGELIHVCVFGAASIHGRALGFHVLTENGAVIWRLPLHAFCHKPNDAYTTARLASVLGLFQLRSNGDRVRAASGFPRPRPIQGPVLGRGPIHVHSSIGVRAKTPKKPRDGGHKCAHLIALDNGNFAAQPNNRIQWFCPAFVTPFQEKPDYVTNTRVWKVERETETTQAFFYDTVSADPRESQVSLYVKGLRTPG